MRGRSPSNQTSLPNRGSVNRGSIVTNAAKTAIAVSVPRTRAAIVSRRGWATGLRCVQGAVQQHQQDEGGGQDVRLEDIPIAGREAVRLRPVVAGDHEADRERRR